MVRKMVYEGIIVNLKILYNEVRFQHYFVETTRCYL